MTEKYTAMDLETALAKIEEGVKAIRIMPGYEADAYDIQLIVDSIREDAADENKDAAA